MGFRYDFSGYATKNDLRCSDGRVIRKNAFKDNDGMTVPLVWQHQHDDPANVLGHALLENRDDGVYVYGIFNNTDSAKQAKALVQHGDINSLSIYANKLKQNGHDVLHGSIKEVSLVLAGANPGAYIDQTSIAHADGVEPDDAIIYTNEFIQNGGEAVMAHDDYDYGYDPDDEDYDDDEYYDDDEVERIFDSLNDEQQDLVYSILETALDDGYDDDDDFEHSDIDEVFDTLNDEQRDMVYYLLADALDSAQEDNYMQHSDDRTIGDIFNSLSEKQKQVAYYLIGEALEAAKNGDTEGEISHADIPPARPGEETVADVFDTFTEEQKNVIYYLIGEALESEGGEMAQYDEGDGSYMMTNVFESGDYDYEDYILEHADIDGMREDIITNAKRYGSLKDATEDVLEHADNYGIIPNPDYDNLAIDVLFPDATSITRTPEFIKRRTEWADVFLSRSTHKPFARVKTLFADITEDDARAKGYIKAKQKKDEFFKLAKRVTTPQTIYKRTKFDRDDVIDITDFDIIPWIKSEMRMMLDEEIARAALVGDNRPNNDDDKIKEENVRSVLNDDDLFTIKYDIGVPYSTSSEITDEISEKVIDGAILSRPKYEGSGRPVCFIDDNLLAYMLVQKDDIGRRLYKDERELANLMGVSEVISCPFMAKLERKEAGDENKKHNVFAILVNPVDYVFGADKGGALSMFDDFDINFNQMVYLMETRTSGALVKAHSAVVIESQASTS